MTGIKTERVRPGASAIESVLDGALSSMPEAAVLAVTSKVVAICEGAVVPRGSVSDKRVLVEQESDYYLPVEHDHLGLCFTIIHSSLVPAAGIDESNADDHYVLWPKDPQQSANRLRAYLRKRFDLKELGVVITDSTARPLHFGTEGIGIAFSGFRPTKSYLGRGDLFGRPLQHTVANLVDGLASAAVVVMGEGDEQTPLAIIEDVPVISFVEHDPDQSDISDFFIPHQEDDLFAPLLRNAPWLKGGREKESA